MAISQSKATASDSAANSAPNSAQDSATGSPVLSSPSSSLLPVLELAPSDPNAALLFPALLGDEGWLDATLSGAGPPSISAMQQGDGTPGHVPPPLPSYGMYPYPYAYYQGMPPPQGWDSRWQSSE